MRLSTSFIVLSLAAAAAYLPLAASGQDAPLAERVLAVNADQVALGLEPVAEEAIELADEGVQFFQNGQTARCLERLDRALEISPSYFTARTRRGNLFFAIGDGVGAMEDATAMIAMAPTRPEGYDLRSKLAESQERWADAIRDATVMLNAVVDFDRAVVLSGDEINLIFARSQFRQSLGDISGAMDDLRAVVRVHGPRRQIASAIVELIEASQTVLQSEPVTFAPGAAAAVQRQLLEEARVLAASRGITAAIAKLDAAIDLGPTASLYVERAILKMQTETFEATGSMEDAGAALQLDSRHRIANLIIAAQTLIDGDHAGALIDFNLLLEGVETSRLDGRLSQWGRRRDAVEKVIAAGGEDPGALYLAIAAIAEADGQWALAQACLKGVIRHGAGGGDPAVFQRLGIAKFRQGDVDMGLAYLDLHLAMEARATRRVATLTARAEIFDHLQRAQDAAVDREEAATWQDAPLQE
jgi:tetratricopeptide (TPR) repeat protein